MASVLAIVSKALFEKMVPKNVALGTVVDTDRYVSGNKTFDTLEDGGSIFLVTVRPPDEKLWLVAILEKPKQQKGDAWVSKANSAPLADITAAIPKLKFQSGSGLKAKKGALGMSLQTPRALTADDEKLLRQLGPGASKGKGKGKAAKKITALTTYNAAVKETLSKNKAKKKGAASSKSSKSPKSSKKNGGGGALRFEHHRKPFEDSIDDLEPHEKKQLEVLVKEEGGGGSLKELFANNDGESEFSSMEVVDVIDASTEDVQYQFYLWPYGSGALFKNKTTKLVGNVCQHGFELVAAGGKALIEDLSDAWFEGAKRLKIKESVDFSQPDDEDEDE